MRRFFVGFFIAYAFEKGSSGESATSNSRDLENFDIILSPYNTQPDEILQRVHLLAVIHLNVFLHSSGTDVLEGW